MTIELVFDYDAREEFVQDNILSKLDSQRVYVFHVKGMIDETFQRFPSLDFQVANLLAFAVDKCPDEEVANYAKEMKNMSNLLDLRAYLHKQYLELNITSVNLGSV